MDDAVQPDAITMEDAGRDAIADLARHGAEYHAVFASSDGIAIAAMCALAAAGRSVPDDVAIVGFDDIPSALLTTPPLKTVTQDARQTGNALVRTVLAQLRGEVSDAAPLPTRLVIHASSGA